MFRAISYSYSTGDDLFRVVVQDKETSRYNHVEIGIVDYIGKLAAELAELVFDDDYEDDAISTALCYLDKLGLVEKYLDEVTGDLRWVNKVKAAQLNK